MWKIILLKVLFSILIYSAANTAYSTTDDTTEIIKIGVLSHRGDANTKKIWQATAAYLSQQLPHYTFIIQPLKFDEINRVVESQSIDFILVNSGIYVNLEVRYRISRLATMNNRRNGQPYNIFAGVIFTRSKHPSIKTLHDLRGKSFMAVDKTSLGGFQMAWHEFQQYNIDPYHDFSSLQFGGIHDHVVMSVIKGDVDAGTVRTDILERMVKAGKLKSQQFRILNAKNDSSFPFLHSTRLYPEWPFSKLHHTPNRLAQDVALALLQMPNNHSAALAGNYAGWTIPLDYQAVHELFKQLKLPPYDSKFTLWEVTQQYWYWAVISLLALLVLGFISIFLNQRNHHLKDEKASLKRQHTLILNSVGDGIYGVDIAGNSTFVNTAMENMTGWKANDMIGKNQHDILHHTHTNGRHHFKEECPVYQTFQDNKARFISDDVFWRKDGSSFPVEYSTTPIRSDKGKTIGSVVVFRDITARKQAAAKREEHQIQLSHVARLSTLGEISSSIAHELNQPLTAIATNARACVRMLEFNNPATERCADVVEGIAKQAERAGDIIANIRHFSHKEPSLRQASSIRKMINTVLELLQTEIRHNNIQVDLDIATSIDLVIAQAIQIEQVILNLIRNAIDAMKNNQQKAKILTITVSKKTRNTKPELAEIRISDTGVGLNNDLGTQIFDAFISTKSQGLGLGLSISYSIIENHESLLQFDPSLEQGASFYFTLPIVNH
jgi:two-component system sensor histidine kinase TtrS